MSKNRTVHLSQPVTLRLSVPDEHGATPRDIHGQEIKDRATGAPAKPMKTAEFHYKKGVNTMPAEHADHPYIKAHTTAADSVPDYTVSQLEQMLEEARLREGGGTGGQGGGNKSSSSGSAGNDDGAPPNGFEWPNDDAIQALDYKGQGDLLAKRGIADKDIPRKGDDRLSMILDRRAKDTAKK